MDGAPSSEANYHALLIGINTYNKLPLNGSVNDVKKVGNVLKGHLGDKIRIRLLTATEKQRDRHRETGPTVAAADAPRGIVEQRASRPTWRNVFNALTDLKKDAAKGDYVYFHYSGHGAREAPNVEEDDLATNKFTGDLALCLLGDDDPWEVALMNGKMLAEIFHGMVEDKGIVLTVVLDCCFSATVYRVGQDKAIRCLQQGQTLRSAHRGGGGGGIVYRNLSMSRNWLMDASKYAILTASGPHESALEIKEDGNHFGKLSFFLHEILEGRDRLRMRTGSIHRHLRGIFYEDAQWNTPQFPCLFGNKKQIFLGPALSSDSDGDEVEIPIVRTSNGLILLAGEAHGLQKGDQVTVQAKKADASTAPIKLNVLELRGVTSIVGGDQPPGTLRDSADAKSSGRLPDQSRREPG